MENYDLVNVSSSWTEVGAVLDPFIYNGDIWVTLSFPGTKLASRSAYLFLVINVSTPAATPIQLSASTLPFNNVPSSFALIDYRIPTSP